MNRTSPADNSVQRLVLLFRGAVQNTRLLVIHPCLLVDQATGKPTTCRQVRSKCGFLRTLKVRRDFHGIISCRITLSDALSEKVSRARCERLPLSILLGLVARAGPRAT